MSHKSLACALFGVVAAITLAAGSAQAATSCEDLAKTALPHTQVTSATLVAAGKFTPPAGPGAGNPNNNKVYATLPAFCRIQATSKPTPTSDIKLEIWLPAEKWNGRLEALGNGGFSPNIMLNNLAQAVAQGYAAVGNNTGQDTGNADFSIGHPERIPDWGSRAVHESVVNGKALAQAHYGMKPAYAYWNSCSTGGRQGLVAAEYYPDDFDGLAVGDPANPMTRLQANSIYINLALNKDAESFITQEKWAAIAKVVMEQCDAKDGLKDGLINNPMACNFKVETLQCKGEDKVSCLTAPQIVAYRKILTGSVNPRTGEHLYPGYPFGTEMLPGPVAGKNPDNSAPATFKMLFQDKDWDFHTFDFDKDTARAAKLGNDTIDAVDEKKLAKLFAHGGKLFMYHGWVDPAISPLISVDYYTKAVAANGGKAKADQSIRLFLVPGMAHCGGGYGPNTFDKMEVISNWVEKGQAPDRIIASRVENDKVVRTRPLCPYPQVSKYKGAGSVDDAANFACVAPAAATKKKS